MTTHIEIENGLVSVVEKTVSQTVPLADWLPLIERRAPISAPVLPTGTRAVHWDPTDLGSQKLIVLMEREPFVANINYGNGIHRVAIPFTRFVFFAHTADPTQTLRWSLDDYRIFWSSHRYGSPDQQDMIPAMLPNCYADGRICFGTTAANANQSLADRLDQTVNEFYISRFNGDLGMIMPSSYHSWAQWVTATAADPNIWTQWPEWRNPTRGALTSFSDVIQQHRAGLVLRDTPVVTPDPIPPLELGASFGRLSEWLRNPDITPANRDRLRVAIDALRAEDPTLFGA